MSIAVTIVVQKLKSEQKDQIESLASKAAPLGEPDQKYGQLLNFNLPETDEFHNSLEPEVTRLSSGSQWFMKTQARLAQRTGWQRLTSSFQNEYTVMAYYWLKVIAKLQEIEPMTQQDATNCVYAYGQLNDCINQMDENDELYDLAVSVRNHFLTANMGFQRQAIYDEWSWHYLVNDVYEKFHQTVYTWGHYIQTQKSWAQEKLGMSLRTFDLIILGLYGKVKQARRLMAAHNMLSRLATRKGNCEVRVWSVTESNQRSRPGLLDDWFRQQTRLNRQLFQVLECQVATIDSASACYEKLDKWHRLSSTERKESSIDEAVKALVDNVVDLREALVSMLDEFHGITEDYGDSIFTFSNYQEYRNLKKRRNDNPSLGIDIDGIGQTREADKATWRGDIEKEFTASKQQLDEAYQKYKATIEAKVKRVGEDEPQIMVLISYWYEEHQRLLEHERLSHLNQLDQQRNVRAQFIAETLPLFLIRKSKVLEGGAVEEFSVALQRVIVREQEEEKNCYKTFSLRDALNEQDRKELEGLQAAVKLAWPQVSKSFEALRNYLATLKSISWLEPYEAQAKFDIFFKHIEAVRQAINTYKSLPKDEGAAKQLTIKILTNATNIARGLALEVGAIAVEFQYLDRVSEQPDKQSLVESLLVEQFKWRCTRARLYAFQRIKDLAKAHSRMNADGLSGELRDDLGLKAELNAIAALHTQVLEQVKGDGLEVFYRDWQTSMSTLGQDSVRSAVLTNLKSLVTVYKNSGEHGAFKKQHEKCLQDFHKLELNCKNMKVSIERSLKQQAQQVTSRPLTTTESTVALTSEPTGDELKSVAGVGVGGSGAVLTSKDRANGLAPTVVSPSQGSVDEQLRV